MIKKILTLDNPLLHKESKEVSLSDKGLNKLISNLFDTLEHSGKDGLAAVQIGILKQIFVINKRGFKQVFINPEIVVRSKLKESFKETCLSVPGKVFEIKRHSVIRMHYCDENLIRHEFVPFFDSIAGIIQHEYDHLNGVLLK